MTSPPSRSHRVSLALLALGVVFAAGATGSLATLPNIPTWYAHIHKPSFTPPNWLFGPAWTLLYSLMAVAFWRILTLPATTSGKRPAIAWFMVQIVLNALWSIAFFGLHAPAAGLVVIALMLAAIVMTIVTFARLDRIAAALLVPYLLWVGFASALNAAVYFLNR